MPSEKTKKLLEGLGKITDSAPSKFEQQKFHSYTNRFYRNFIHKLPAIYDKAKAKKDEDGDDVFVVALPICFARATNASSTSLTYQYLSILSSLPSPLLPPHRARKNVVRRGGGLREEEEEEEEEEVDNGAIACEAEEEIT